MSDAEIANLLDILKNHLKTYVETDGAEGHLIDFTPFGGHPDTTTLLLKTIGRKSGTPLTVALIYGKIGDEYAIVASRGGSDVNPAWFYNVTAQPEAVFQVGREHLKGTWRIPEGEERQKVWDFMSDVYPPYPDYQAKTEREIPIVLLKAVA